MPRRPAVVPSSDAVISVLRKRRAREERRDDRLATWPRWRVNLNHVVRKDPWFERCIFGLIAANCVTISLDNLWADRGVLEVIEAVFTLIFFTEMIIKCVARGVVGEFGYFGSNANRFDFLLVIVSTYGLLQSLAFPNFSGIPAFTATAARTARLLRPLRSINILQSLRIIVESISTSASRLAHLMVFAAIFAISIGLIALTFFRGSLRHHCHNVALNTTRAQECDAPDIVFRPEGAALGTVLSGYVCPWGEVCIDAGNLGAPFINFDFILPTGITLFMILMLEDWAAIMYRVVDALGQPTQIYFLGLVLIGTMFVLNLVLATVSDAFTSTLAALRDDMLRQQPKKEAPRGLSTWRLHFVAITKHVVFQKATMALTIVNVALLASVYHGMPQDAEDGLTLVTVVLAFFFLIQTTLKLLAKPLRDFMADPLNPFDALLSVGSLVEFFLLGTAAVNALRSVRLLRLLEVTNSMRATLRTLSNALSAAGPLLLLLFLVVFLFALLGMQLFSGKMCGFDTNPLTSVNTIICDGVPRLNFDNIGYAIVTTFTIVAGDGWQNIMSNGMRAQGDFAAFYFVACMCVGGLLMINLLVAVLIHATATEHAASDAAEKVEVAQETDSDDDAAVVLFLMGGKDNDETRDAGARGGARRAPGEGSNAADDLLEMESMSPASMAPLSRKTPPPPINNGASASDDRPVNVTAAASVSIPAGDEHQQAGGVKKKRVRKDPNALEGFDDVDGGDADVTGLSDALIAERNEREAMRRQESVEMSKNIVRRACRVIVNSRPFSGFIVLTIVFSVLVMCAQSPLEPPDSPNRGILDWTDIAVGGVFVLEALLKLIWLGPYSCNKEVSGKGYFQNRWFVFDFIVTLAAAAAAVLVVIAEPWSFALAKWLRVVRVLRPWSLVGRSRSTMLVFRALTEAMSSMTNLAVIAACVWLMYGILGTQVFRGKSYACTSVEWGDETYDGARIYDRQTCLVSNFTWENNQRNFDNVGESMLTLFGVATTDMWTEVMFLNADGHSFDEAPRSNERPFMVLYTISFVTIASFFLLNMTVSVLIDAYMRTRKIVEEALRRSLLHQHKIDSLSADQEDFIDLYRRCLVFFKPPLRPPYGPTSCRRLFRKMVRKRYYDYGYVLVAAASVAVQASAFAEMPPIYDDLLVAIDAVFTAAFWLSLAFNVVGYGFKEYFATSRSARLELMVNVVTTGAIIARIVVGPNAIIDLIRIARVLRLQRAFRVSTGLRLFLDTLVASWRTCVAVFLLVFLVFFMYAALGMNLFSAVKRGDGITRHANFERIDSALVTLLRVATFDDWQLIMWDCAAKAPDCDPNIGECGYPGLAQLYFFSFICLGSWIGLNFFTAVLLEAFARSDREDRMAVQQEHIKHFRDTWKQFTPTDLLPMPVLPIFLRRLKAPLGPREGESSQALATALESLMSVNNEVFQADVFDALMRHYYGEDLPGRSDDTLRKLLSASFRKRLYAGSRFASGWPARTVSLIIRVQALWRARTYRRRAAGIPPPPPRAKATAASKRGGDGKSPAQREVLLHPSQLPPSQSVGLTIVTSPRDSEANASFASNRSGGAAPQPPPRRAKQQTTATPPANTPSEEPASPAPHGERDANII